MILVWKIFCRNLPGAGTYKWCHLCKYKYLSLKYQYKYQYLDIKYQYQYQYPSLKYKY